MPARGGSRGAKPAGERFGDEAGVSDLARHARRRPPRPQDARAAAVADAVRGELMDGDHEVVASRAVEAGRRGKTGDAAAEPGEPREVEGELLRLDLRLRERRGEGRRHSIDAAVVGARTRHAALAHVRVAAAAFGDQDRVERGRVIRAHERPRRAGAERQVQKLLVPLALDELVGRPGGRDRLTDSVHRPPGGEMRRRELVPGVDDAAGVHAGPVHVGEHHLVGRGAEPLAQAPDLAVAERHHHRLADRDALSQDRLEAVHELVVTRVQHRLVTKAHRRTSTCGSVPGAPARMPFSR